LKRFQIILRFVVLETVVWFEALTLEQFSGNRRCFYVLISSTSIFLTIDALTLP
jgi:hypothetical protein